MILGYWNSFLTLHLIDKPVGWLDQKDLTEPITDMKKDVSYRPEPGTLNQNPQC